MGRKSVKDKKTNYQLAREEQDLTREEAAELIGAITPERLEKIENERTRIQPEDVMLLAKAYKKPQLCNYYCSHDCPIGKDSVPEIPQKELSQIAVETVNSLNHLNSNMNRFFEIVEDGSISKDEYSDFIRITEMLKKISLISDSLKLWLDQAEIDGKITE